MAIIDCVCPPLAGGQTRHPNGDTVTLREKLGFHAATSVRQQLKFLYGEDPNPDVGEVLAVFTEAYLIHGIESWTLVDTDGDPLPATRGNIRAFLEAHIIEAQIVGDEADNMYSEAVLLPLADRASKSSQPTPTDDSTSLTSGSTSTPPTPSSPSSTTTTPTDDIETTSRSLAGVSS